MSRDDRRMQDDNTAPTSTFLLLGRTFAKWHDVSGALSALPGAPVTDESGRPVVLLWRRLWAARGLGWRSSPFGRERQLASAQRPTGNADA